MTLSDDELSRALIEGLAGKLHPHEWERLFHASGPYDVSRPNAATVLAARAVEAAVHAKMADVLKDAARWRSIDRQWTAIDATFDKHDPARIRRIGVHIDFDPSSTRAARASRFAECVDEGIERLAAETANPTPTPEPKLPRWRP